ncbi:MAG: nitroreductase family protein [Candidatus Bathyarchaeia archaeon]
MDLFEAIEGRRSIRSFLDKPVPKEFVMRILEAGQLAPSAGNCQARQFILVEDQEVKRKLYEAAWKQEFILQAPINIVVCADELRSSSRYGERGRRLYCILDASASVENMLLAAHGLGLGACWIGAYQDEKVKEALGLPDHLKPIAIIPIGYPARQPPARPRLPVEALLHYNRYGGKGYL